MERLYPNLGQSPPSRLNLSNAFNTSGFKTVNDKVLMEMNLRAQRQLEGVSTPKANIFDYQPTVESRRQSLRKSPKSPGLSKRFSRLHCSQFARMESIETHPSLKLRRPAAKPVSPTKKANVRIANAPVLFGQPAPQTKAEDLQDKRQGEGLGSPSKRRRTVVKNENVTYEPIQTPQQPTRRPMQTGFFRSRGTAQARPTSTNCIQSPPKRLVRSHTSAQLTTSRCSDELPSYARPTQAALRKSHSTRALAARGDTVLNQMPIPPKEGHSPTETRRLFAGLEPAPHILNTRSRARRP
ncbi:hypothetical protein B9G98_00284 [Wickerhamiella sorbophila]|uniref:Uncharacterized protein n=1 Tax=Wickerhamiella sorbophila TaxID=45607 RepID=A0A2T0FCC8_9ASCO|nr:hypothetical protein B9G98_00284 [Wickerhamiella sorbophila]PRT52664.1 hypothetical protein B9G98_00284 [Wickerhamiella sorbophila]